MKRFSAMVLLATLLVALTACGANNVPVESAPRVRRNRIILGDTTELTGDFTGGLITNGASDQMIDRLVNDYATMVTDRGGN